MRQGAWSEPYVERSTAIADPRALSVPHLLADRAAVDDGRRAVTVAGETRSFGDLRTAAARLAAELARRGVMAGDRVLLMGRNDIRYVERVLACLWLGAVVVPVNTAWRGRQLVHLLADASPVVVIADAEHRHELRMLDAPESLAFVVAGAGTLDTGESLWGLPVEELVAGDDESPLREIHPSELAAIIYTSGTTGLSKGVMCPAGQLYWWTNVMQSTLRVAEGSVLYSTLPLFHINALASVFLAIATGAGIVLDGRFSASRYWERARESGATHVALLGAMAGMLLAQPAGDADRRHRVTTAFAPDIPANLWDQFAERFGVEEIIAAYAGTETNQVISATEGARSERGYMGRVVRGFHARVVDEFDCDVPDGRPGELVLRTDLPFAFCLGYFNRPEDTTKAMRNLWWHTGDRVVRDPDGRFRFVDRLKDMIRRRGENISTWEVEEALLTHPEVVEAAVFGVPSALGDEDVAAAVVLVADGTATPAQLVGHLEGRIAYFAVPRYVELCASLPHTENGKVSKAPLRARGVTPAMWDRGETRSSAARPLGPERARELAREGEA